MRGRLFYRPPGRVATKNGGPSDAFRNALVAGSTLTVLLTFARLRVWDPYMLVQATVRSTPSQQNGNCSGCVSNICHIAARPASQSPALDRCLGIHSKKSRTAPNRRIGDHLAGAVKPIMSGKHESIKASRTTEARRLPAMEHAAGKFVSPLRPLPHCRGKRRVGMSPRRASVSEYPLPYTRVCLRPLFCLPGLGVPLSSDCRQRAQTHLLWP